MDTSFNSEASSETSRHAPKGLSRAQLLLEIGKYTGGSDKKQENDAQSLKSFAILEHTQSTVSFESRSEVRSAKSIEVREGVFTQQIQERNVDFQFTSDPSQPLCPNTAELSTQGSEIGEPNSEEYSEEISSPLSSIDPESKSDNQPANESIVPPADLSQNLSSQGHQIDKSNPEEPSENVPSPVPPDEKKSNQEPTQGNELSFTESEVNVLGGYGLNLADVCSPQSHPSTEDTNSEEKVTEAELRILNDFGVELPASQKDEMECSEDSQLSENSQSTGKSIKTVTKHVESQNEAIEEVADPSLCVVSNKTGIVQIYIFLYFKCFVT